MLAFVMPLATKKGQISDLFRTRIGAYQGLAKSALFQDLLLISAALWVQVQFQNPRQTPVGTKLRLKRRDSDICFLLRPFNSCAEWPRFL